jgi:hypothetical protein
MPKIKQKTIETVVTEGGEVKHHQENYLIQYDSEPNYVKLYLDTVLYLSDLPKGYNGILFAFLKYMTYSNSTNTYGGQIIYFNAAMKKAIANELNVSISRINQAITDFTKGKILERMDVGTYRVNPHLFGKGDWQDIAEVRMKITFNVNGKTVMSEIEKHDDKAKKATKRLVVADLK